MSRRNLSLSSDVVAEVERRAAASGRSLDLEYGRLFALGLLAKLIGELAPLFPELGRPALPHRTKRPEAFTSGLPGHAVDDALNSAIIPLAGPDRHGGGDGNS